ncbi:hypothetical protein, partial [Streptomyces sp. NPDC054838]
MSRARGVWWLLGAVLAVLLAGTAPAAPSAAEAPVAGAEATAVAYEGHGPACSPGAGDHGQAPAVPPRDGRDHACAPAVRLPAGPDPVARAVPAGVRVRGPDRPAPGPLE